MSSIPRLLPIVAFTLALAPAGAHAQDVKVASGESRPAASLLDAPARLDIRQVPLIDALARLEQTAGLALAYSPSLLPRVTVSCACTDSTVASALRAILAGTGFSFSESEQQVILVPEPAAAPRELREPRVEVAARAPSQSAAAAQEPAVVMGRVTTASAAPLAGALVSVVGADRSTLSDANGRFRIVIPEARISAAGDTLLVTLLGYADRRVPFEFGPGDVRLEVAMQVDAMQLGEILVTGTAGNQKRGAQAAVISRIDAEEVLERAPVSTVTQVLRGRVPGIGVADGSGTSGTASRINIRGAASLSLSNEPLVFIDGVRMESRQRQLVDVGGQTMSALNELNPDDIVRIEVVKGPAAATLYGADASAGVIQIFTKQGEAGVDAMVQTLSVEYGTIEPNFTPYTNYARCPGSLVDPGVGHPLCAGLTAGDVVTDNPMIRQAAFRDGQATSLQYSIRGGGDAYGYYASFGADDEDGTTRNNSLERRTGRVNFDWIANDELSFNARMGLARNEVHLPPGDQSSYGYMIGAGLGSPLTLRTAADGGLAGGWLLGNESVEAISSITSEVSTLRVTPSAQVRYNPVPWLTNRLTLGADVSESVAQQLYPRNDQGWYSGEQGNGWVQSGRSSTQLYTVDYLGNITTSFGGDDRFTSDLSFGSQFISRTARGLTAEGIGLTTNTSNLISSAATNTAGEGYNQQESLGLFLQEQVGFRERLYVQVGARMDRNSAFGSDAGWFFLPKVGFSYILSEEPFWAAVQPWISTFRLRAAYGSTGRAPQPGAALRTYVSVPYVTDAGRLVPGLAPLNPGNQDLLPERGTEFEAGFDAGFLDNRAGLELTFFEKRTSDLLIQVPLAPSAGFTSRPWQNIGEVLNRGLELAVRATPISRPGLNWDLSVHGSTLHNELVSLGDLDPFFNSYRAFTPGRELGAWFVNRIREVDVEGGRVIVSDTAEYLGGQLPELQGAVASTFTFFGNLRVTAQLDGKFGYRIYNLGHEYRDRFFRNSAEAVLDPDEGGYSEEEALRRYGPYFTEGGAQVPFTEVKEDYIQPADHVRLSEVSATYTIPDRFVQRLGVTGASITLGGRNLALWSDFEGFDPEVLGTGPGNPGDSFYTQFYTAEVFTTPPARRWTARVNFSF